MGILKGMMTVRRYNVLGDIPQNYGHEFHEKLQEHAFQSSSFLSGKEEIVGWTLLKNLLETDFSDIDQWLCMHYITAMMRVDKRNVPSNLFRAHFEQRCAEWCENHDKKHCPARIKEEIKDKLRFELISKSLPKVSTVEFCWNVKNQYLLVHNTSDSMNDRFITLFYETFGLQLELSSLTDFISDDTVLQGQLERCGATDLSNRGGV